jgi:O-methyltransferase
MTDVVVPFTDDDADSPAAAAAVPHAPSAPQQRWRSLRPFVPKRMQPFLRGMRKRMQWRRWRRLEEPFRTIFPYTQVNTTRQHNLLRLCEQLERDGVPGAIVECGVLDGGAAALMAWGTRASARAVHLFDAWAGLPQPSAQDGTGAAAWTGEVVGSPVRVNAVMRKLQIDPARVLIHRGWFDQTFPTADIPQIALLHVDADFYEPTRLCLRRWYPHVASGGFIELDDYDSFAGCRRAVDEFLREHPELRLEFAGKYAIARACFIRKP